MSTAQIGKLILGFVLVLFCFRPIAWIIFLDHVHRLAQTLRQCKTSLSLMLYIGDYLIKEFLPIWPPTYNPSLDAYIFQHPLLTLVISPLRFC